MRQRNPRGPNLTTLLIEKVRTRLKAGDSVTEIQEHFGLARTTVYRIKKGQVTGRKHRENPVKKFPRMRFELVQVQPLSDAKTGRSYSLAPSREKQSA